MKSLLIVFAAVFVSMACYFQVGDVVKLKSGGDNMVVIGIEEDCSVYVAYFGYRRGVFGIQRGIFPDKTVVMAPKEE